MHRNETEKRHTIGRKLAVLILVSMLLNGLVFPSAVSADGAEPLPEGYSSEEDLSEEFEALAQEAEAAGAAFDGYIVELAPEAENLSETPAEESTEEIEFAENLCVAESAEALLDDYDCRDVVSVEPNYIVTLQDHDYSEPDDPEYPEQTNLQTMHVPSVWERGYEGQTQTGEDVVVAVIDSGLNLSHEDFDYYHILPGRNWAPDSAGEIDEADVSDDLGHGTLCASIIMATKNNGLGTAGILQQVFLLPLKAFDAKQTTVSRIISALEYSVAQKMEYDMTQGISGTNVSVINMSFGAAINSAALKTACENTVAAGILLVVSAGNTGESTLYEPAAYDCVVGVGSVGIASDPLQVSSFAPNRGMENVFCAAPGYLLKGAYIGSSDAYVGKEKIAAGKGSGTSFSSPEVAALGALAKSIDPDIDQNRFMQMIMETAVDLGDKGRDDVYGYGLVNFEEALLWLTGNPEDPGGEDPTEPGAPEEPGTPTESEAPSEPVQEEIIKITPTVSLSKTSYVYNGTVRKPKVTVQAGGKTLSASDYTVTYASGRKKVGTYKVTVKLKGSYEGKKTVSFKILPQKTAVASVKAAKKAFTVKWKKQTAQTTGYQIQYSTDKTFAAGKKTLTLNSAKTVSKKISGLKAKKTYYVRVRTFKTVAEKKYCSAWSAKTKVKTK